MKIDHWKTHFYPHNIYLSLFHLHFPFGIILMQLFLHFKCFFWYEAMRWQLTCTWCALNWKNSNQNSIYSRISPLRSSPTLTLSLYLVSAFLPPSSVTLFPSIASLFHSYFYCNFVLFVLLFCTTQILAN